MKIKIDSEVAWAIVALVIAIVGLLLIWYQLQETIEILEAK